MSLIYNATFDSQTRVLSLLDKAGNVISSCEVPSKSNELKLTATKDNSSVKLTKNGTLSNTYEVNTGSGWQSYTFGTVIPLNAGESCKWRCSAHPTTQDRSNYVKFVTKGKCSVSGNCNAMLSSDFENMTSLSEHPYAFYNLFQGCASLTQAPELPATTLAQSCYESMFKGCTSLAQAPELPATTLPQSCYFSMFQGCASLTQAPELPATTLPQSCYFSMFKKCASLTQAPELPATTLAQSCYDSMFDGCASLTQAPELPATTLASYCYSRMFSGCTSLTQAPELPATTLAHNCYGSMFAGCTSLTQAPSLPATTLASFCYDGMFYGCTSLTQAPALPATTLAEQYCYRSMFQGCTSLTQAPELPATTLTSYCYPSMFQGCTSLNEIRVSATDISADRCTWGWVKDVSSTGDFYCNPDTAWTTGLHGIPSGWTRLPLSDYPQT